MTDHRVTDLSHGHPGKATYDTEEQKWTFSQTFTNGPSVKQLLPFKEMLAPSTHVAKKGDGRFSILARNQMRWLQRTLPESLPASPLLSNLVKASCQPRPERPADTGPLLAFGRALDPDRLSGGRRPQIMAIPFGGAGHILRLIRPRVETLGWGKASAARLSLLNLQSIDAGHWFGTGGTIRQIVFADSVDETEIWLAVRQASVTTVFQPRYGRIWKPPVPVNENPVPFGPSLVDANPIASLTIQRTGSICHADVAFNPWFPRHIAVVDTQGFWSIWELELHRGKNAAAKYLPREAGGIYDGQTQNDSSLAPAHDHADGWYRIMWICNIHTIIVCNRRYIAAFDLKGTATLVGQASIFPAGNTDWILDIQRSTSDLNQVYVLTTTRIFWLELVPDGEQDGNGHVNRAKIIMSFLHFMSPDDEAMKLALFKSDLVSVAIISAKTRVLKYFSFRDEPSGARVASTGAMSLSSIMIGGEERSSLLHTVQFLPCKIIPSASHTSGPGLKYMEENVEFFQLWALTSDQGLVSTLSAIAEKSKQLEIIAPDNQLLITQRYRAPKLVDDQDFVVSDEDTDIIVPWRTSTRSLVRPSQKDCGYRTLDWKMIYQRVYSKQSTRPDSNPEFAERLSFASVHIRQALENGELLNSTLSGAIGVLKPAADLQRASEALREFLTSLTQDQMPDASRVLTVTNLTQGCDVRFAGDPGSNYPDFVRIFDQLVEYWMASLPINLHNLARHAKFKAISQLTMELVLCSIAISIQEQNPNVPGAAAQDDEDDLTMSQASKDNRSLRDGSPAIFSSELPVAQDEAGLPTPTSTPSLYSQATSASVLLEDPVIARLRRYAPTIKDKPDSTVTTQASILSHWPMEAGADPANYSYEKSKLKQTVSNQGFDARLSKKKDKARRHRRTEEFVKAVEPAVSRRASFFPGSQPEIANQTFSSQAVNDMPMTQPDRGAFGSRDVPQRKKKAKKPRTAGFK